MPRQTGAKKHTHRYYRRDDGLWACALDGCTHFMPSNMNPAPLGAYSICWKCGEKFTLTSTNMLKNRPECDECSGAVDQSEYNEARLIIGMMGIYRVKSLTTEQRRTLRLKHGITENILKRIEENQRELDIKNEEVFSEEDLIPEEDKPTSEDV
jgi:hypothetical protein